MGKGPSKLSLSLPLLIAAVSTQAASTLHPEAAQGGLAQVPGFNDVVTTAIDPESFWAGGTLWLDNADGYSVELQMPREWLGARLGRLLPAARG